MKVGRYFIFLLIPLLFWQSFFSAAASASTAEVLKQHQMLKHREQQIIAELVKTELALDRLNTAYSRLQAELLQVRSTIPAARRQLDGAQERLRQCRKKLGLWLRYFYIEGRTNFIFMLLGAVNTGDFFNRLALVGVLVSRGMADFQQTLAAVEEVKQRTAALDQLEKKLADRQRELAGMLEQAKLLQLTRQHLLSDTRQELGKHQEKVLAVVDGLHTTLKPLETILDRFKNAPWHKYRPDRMQWLGAGVKAEYSEQTLSKLLFAGTGLNQPAEICLSDQLFIIKGTNQDQTPFTIAGELKVIDNDKVCYKIKSIRVGEVVFDKELVELISGKEGLTYPVGLLMGWRLRDIQIEDGKAFFALEPA
ncbi:coiled-coil domain-containing protein [Desulforamulus hydrothermalis]|uniref:Uncharacterized protein n=1 Tax=Desulforamulus hydrothermalis Lam5 = DSM 18033 TaxID=1121428 RepID=K8DZ32_9FIRM|nr:hypothetical protein [Desulforamulus hydrothermalis]CCO08229.1 conserved exported hypothetical protein [Desulforamulus hydrothermalis Lam5 = DSM 18033]SHH21948.1 N-terminal domain of peptidoglycan hydrolase CwlO-containing protein [Desulforamulus hydrothermalis Lam5 = DSM 18033]